MADLYVDTNGILQPIGVTVLRDSREDLLPPTRDISETVSGLDGEFDFGSELNPRIIELYVRTDTMTPEEREAMKRTIAEYLNPQNGAKTFLFEDNPSKMYYVICDGKIQVQSVKNWTTFIIPLKVCNAFIVSTELHTHTGSGTLTNEGTFETPLVIEITGPVTNPSIQVGSDTLTWEGTVGVSDTLKIDSEHMTVTFNGVNAIANYTGGFPKLQPGDTTVTATSGGTTVFKWRSRWI